MIHIISERTANMITYQQLCDKHTEYKTTLLNRRRKLQELIGEFADAIASNLGVNGRSYKTDFSNDLSTVPYVKIIELTSGKFKHIHTMEIPVAFDHHAIPSAEVGISIALEKDEKTYPKTNIYIRLHFTLSNDQLDIKCLDYADVPTIAVDLEDGNKWEYAIEAYKKMVLRSITLE